MNAQTAPANRWIQLKDPVVLTAVYGTEFRVDEVKGLQPWRYYYPVLSASHPAIQRLQGLKRPTSNSAGWHEDYGLQLDEATREAVAACRLYVRMNEPAWANHIGPVAELGRHNKPGLLIGPLWSEVAKDLKGKYPGAAMTQSLTFIPGYTPPTQAASVLWIVTGLAGTWLSLYGFSRIEPEESTKGLLGGAALGIVWFIISLLSMIMV